MAKPPPVGTTPPPLPKVPPNDPPVAARTEKKTATPEEMALAADLASATKYCEFQSRKPKEMLIMRCDMGAGRFGGGAKDVQGLRWREAKIKGLPVSFAPAGYDAVAAGDVKGYMVLELNEQLHITYGRFVAVKTKDYEDYLSRNKDSYFVIGTPVQIDRSLLVESERPERTPENFPAYFQRVLTITKFPAKVVNIRVAMEDGALTISLVIEARGGKLPAAKMTAIRQQIQTLVEKQGPRWGLPQVRVTIQSSVVDPH